MQKAPIPQKLPLMQNDCPRLVFRARAAWFLLALTAAVLVCPRPARAAQDSLAKLTESLKSGDEKVRIAAIDSLGHMGVGAKDAVRDLTGQLADNSPRVRAHAARALQLIGPAARPAAGRAGATD